MQRKQACEIHLKPQNERLCRDDTTGEWLFLRQDAFLLDVQYSSLTAKKRKLADLDPEFNPDPKTDVKTGVSAERTPVDWSLPSPILNNHLSTPPAASRSLALQQSRVVIPHNASCLLSDLSTFRFIPSDALYNLVVADPPWPNLSAKRSSAYSSLDPYELFNIKLRDHLLPGALVAVWVTHKKRYSDFVRNKLFPAWGLQFVAEWKWCKVTTKGEPIFDEKLANRKSFELLLIGQRHSDDAIQIPSSFSFSSVPSCHHSQKPFLDSILTPYIPLSSNSSSGITRLELFARITRSGWHCWGNECLKFNDLFYLESRKSIEKPSAEGLNDE